MPRPLTADVPSGGLAWRDRLSLSAEILATYVRVRWEMRRDDLPGTVAMLRSEHGSLADGLHRENCFRLAGAVTRMLSLLPTDSRCLVRSLVLLGLLARRGVDATIVIGVRAAPAFGAHAWVESAGESLLPVGSGEFKPLTYV